MDFKCFYFYDDEQAMMRFVNKNWDRVYNVFYDSIPDAGHVQGWCVNVLNNNNNN